MGSKRYGTNLSSIIGALILVFLGFVIVIVLMVQANMLNTVTGMATLANPNLFFAVIFGALFAVLLGGYLIGKYAEKMRNEKQNIR
jgi:amino acid transporter